MNTSAELSPRRRRRRFLVGYDEGDLSVKREPDDDIKDYAENTMNELLGWYGYEKVDSRDTQGLNLTHFASNNNSGPGGSNHSNQTNGFSPPSSAMEGSDASEDVASHHGGLEGVSSRLRPDSVSPGPDASAASDEVARQHQQMVSALSSITKHPGAPDSPNLPPGCIVCAWCQKVGMKLFTLKTPNGCKAFCSELCFTQCRRASFKKNKICDWCKHVRHTVNYVDFQDGEQQLQFCSDKCLNQYKMNIFCKETQAHLQMHTHLKEAACKIAAGSSVNLITPELWLRDCKTNGNSTSPHETVDVIEDINSDDNLSAAPSPNVISESPLPVTPPLKEKTEHVVESLHTPKEKDTLPKEKVPKKHSSKHSPKKSFGEPRLYPPMKHHRDKRPTDTQLPSENVPNNRHSPSHATPPPLPRSNQITNGSHSLLSSPPMPRHPQSHIGPPPNRHCPPVPSPLPVNNMEHGRHFLPPNMMAPPFQFFAQQHMEAILRSQHGLDLRSKVPPPLPMPPWVMPPFPPAPPPPHPHLPPPMSSRSPSQSHSSPPSRGHVHTPSHKSTHHARHKHNKHGTTNSNNPTSLPPKTTPSVSESQLPSSLLPPVTVMVPFPLVLPLPLPIPVPIPIPPSVMDKFKRSQEQQKIVEEHLDSSTQKLHHQKKQKSNHDSSKHRKKLRLSENGERDLRFPLYEPEMRAQLIANAENFLERSENLSFKSSEITSVNVPVSEKPHKFLRRDIDLESGSYSPLSDIISSDDGEEMRRTLKNSDSNHFSNFNFSSYNLNLLRSSPSVVSQTTGHHSPKTLNENEVYSTCPSPANLTVSDKKRSNMSSDPLNFKKKHLREQLSLMT
ncbi:sine oculis-binding protein homolog A-like [Uloborus diversus]|uniref:sine oculis-binding protein homolog A-like n=1 Tax=Uloborus diversus TaxID=327109 RepID=UPI0024094BA6|nr:sine oculis-binding protein homolog A-like [Uloborus diversus]